MVVATALTLAILLVALAMLDLLRRRTALELAGTPRSAPSRRNRSLTTCAWRGRRDRTAPRPSDEAIQGAWRARS
jgi:hypothetical protein